MNNLHRELAPISDSAWAQIEEEASRTLKRYLAARRIVDIQGPQGVALSAVGTGHTKELPSCRDGVRIRQRLANPVLELRVPFELTRDAIDDVERGSNDSDWQPLKEAAQAIAYAEDLLVFEGYSNAGIRGIRQVSSNKVVQLPSDIGAFPNAVAAAIEQLREAGVNGPYALVLGADPYTAITGGSDEGYPILKHLERLLDKEVIWSPGIKGGLVVTCRGGDFDLYLGQDISIGYLSQTDRGVKLYFQESLTYMTQTPEASVVLRSADEAGEV